MAHVRVVTHLFDQESSLSGPCKLSSTYITHTLGALSDDKSLALFNMCSRTLSRDAGVVMNRLGITRKQYYSRMNRLIDAGLVIRKSGEYFLSSFDKVVYQSNLLIGQAVENYWKLKAIDSLYNDLSAEERKKLIDTLIESSSIKNILEYNVVLESSAKFSGPQKVRVITETAAS